MASYELVKSDFLDKVVTTIEENLGDEEFGVSQLAEQLGMSRSNLLRKVQNLTQASVSILIRQVRLNHAQRLLREGTLNVSEVSFNVGFKSTSYFIKCYKDTFGYSPKAEFEGGGKKEAPSHTKEGHKPHKAALLVSSVFIVIAISIITLVVNDQTPKEKFKKSIAVLPFINDSSDSSNLYIINGVMEAILNNLQKVEELRVVSRSSVEKYRSRPKNIAEMAEELGVNYILEGSGQKVGDQILLTVQLIEAPMDDHLWSERYNRPLGDLFDLQAEIAGEIAKEIEVYVSDEEKRLIEKKPTSNVAAYDFYLQGLDLLNSRSFQGLDDAIVLFRQAVVEDPDFAHAHAYLASCFYYLDLWRDPQQYADSINIHSDRALFLDPELDHSLLAKGLFYMHGLQYERAAEYFEKALDLNPNSARAINLLSITYGRFLPNAEKYLFFSLRGYKVNVDLLDSATNSTMHFNIGKAFAQAGFFDEARKHLNTSKKYDARNLFAELMLAMVTVAQNNDLEAARSLLTEIHNKDTSRLDIIRQLADVCYTMEDYSTAHFFYDKLLRSIDKNNLNFFDPELSKIGFVMQQVGDEEKAKYCFDRFSEFAQSDDSDFKEYYLASHYAIHGDVNEGVGHLKEFSGRNPMDHVKVLMLKEEPVIKLLSAHPDFSTTIQDIESSFWNNHDLLESKLNREGLY